LWKVKCINNNREKKTRREVGMESLRKGLLTLTIITQRATSLNYGENIGNVSILKKLTLGDGSQITYVSNRALKFEMRRKGK
jgi:CRISPR-associated protein Cst2